MTGAVWVVEPVLRAASDLDSEQVSLPGGADVVVKVLIGIFLFGVALDTTWSDLARHLRRPWVLAVGVLGLYYLRLPSLAGVGQYTLYADLERSGGLYATGNVTYRGIQIGKVTLVERQHVARDHASRQGRFQRLLEAILDLVWGRAIDAHAVNSLRPSITARSTAATAASLPCSNAGLIYG